MVMESKQQKTKLFLRGGGSSLLCPEPNPGDPDCLFTAWWLSALSASPLPSRNRCRLWHQSALGSTVLPCCLLLPSWLVRSGLRRALGSPAPGDPAPRVALGTGEGPHPAGCLSVKRISAFCSFSSEKNTALLCWLSNICKVSQPLL